MNMRERARVGLAILGLALAGCDGENDAVASSATTTDTVKKAVASPTVSLLEVTGDRYTRGVMHPYEFHRGDVVRVIVAFDPPATKGVSTVWSAPGGVKVAEPAPSIDGKELLFESGDTSTWQRGIHRVDILVNDNRVAHTAFSLL